MNDVYLKNSSGADVYPVRKFSTHTDSECIAAFISYMNEKAVDIGMTNANFIDSIGLASNKATASDMIQLALCATGYDELCSVWNKDHYTMKIKGAHTRNTTIDTTVTDNTFENSYFIFGGKTGTNVVQNVILVAGTGNNKQLICVILDAQGNRFEAAKQACDIAESVLANPDYDYSGDVVSANYVQVSLVPTGNPRIFDGYDLPALYAKAATTQCALASTTKIMTAMCMLDWISDIHEWFTVKASDISTGSGQTMYEGDRITFKDALYAMMLPSSNTCAKAVARVVGERILNNAELA